MSLASSRRPWVLTALRLFSLALIGLHLAAGRLFDEAGAWGLWPYTYLPTWAQWLLAALAALAALPPTAAALVRALARLPRLEGLTSGQRHALLVLLSVLSLVPFTLFRIVHTRWGDAYLLVHGIAYPDPALRLTVTWQAPLDVWLHARLWAVGHALFGWSDAWPTYRILSPLAGTVFVYSLLRLADSVGQGRAEKALIVGLMVTLGTVQLFFGYAENYSLAAAGVLVFLWLALETLAGRRPLWQPALALALTNGLHPSTVVLSPAVLYLAWRWGAKEPGPARWRRAAVQVAAPTLLVAAGVVLVMELNGHGLAALLTTDRPGGGDARPFVPLTEVTTRWERYTMFSWPHLQDWLNMQALTAPVTLGGLILVGAALAVRPRAGKSSASPAPREAERASLAFLALATALYWLFTWVWNPDYGGQRDWDLFSLAALPSTLLLARLLPQALPERRDLAEAGLALIAVSAAHTAAWIYQNTLPWEWT